MVVLSGELTQQEQGQSVKFATGDAMLHPRGATHANTIGESGARTLAIEFADDYLARHLPGNLPHLGRDMALDGAAGRSLAKAARKSDAEFERAVRSALATLACEPRVAPTWIADLKAELDATPAYRSDVPTLSAAAGRHPAHVMREFRRHIGVTIGEYVRSRRVARACKALRDTDAALSDIAAAHGFADQSHFARTFKRFMNMTPDAYRRAHR